MTLMNFGLHMQADSGWSRYPSTPSHNLNTVPQAFYEAVCTPKTLSDVRTMYGIPAEYKPSDVRYTCRIQAGAHWSIDLDLKTHRHCLNGSI
jgi:hypothetical protein